ncbi:ATP-NAD kinase-like domain-containing protein [Limtongia smithiae]|uniref:ATP-NAD kinase-like domain-containing protein n=1 Tax=Limtongia smithiae TaxID=1125753 RepID=UPI0034CF5710
MAFLHSERTKAATSVSASPAAATVTPSAADLAPRGGSLIATTNNKSRPGKVASGAGSASSGGRAIVSDRGTPNGRGRSDAQDLDALAKSPDKKLTSTLSGLQDYFRKPCFVHSRFDDAVGAGAAVEGALADISDENFAHLSHSSLVQTATSVRELAKRIGQATIQMSVRSVLVVTKARDNSLIVLTRELTRWLILTRDVNVYVDAKLRLSKRFDADGLMDDNDKVETHLRYWTPELTNMMPELFDLVLTLGGDGTVLYTSWLFQKIVPPILAFSLGSLGFLTNFPFQEYKTHLNRVFDEGIKVNLRMRFTCTVFKDGHGTETHEVINEIVIDRGPSPWISMLELYGNGHLLTLVQADGLILSTPTGSTAYSLSAGGSLVHPEIPAISVTPICPHTLSFRPMLLPDTMMLKVSVPLGARNTAWASFDGRHRVELRAGDYVTVTASQYPFPTVMAGPMDYIESVSRTLQWNVREHQKPFKDDVDTDSPAGADRGSNGSATTADEEWDIDDSTFFSSSASSTVLSAMGTAPQSAVTTGSSSPIQRGFSFMSLNNKS